ELAVDIHDADAKECPDQPVTKVCPPAQPAGERLERYAEQHANQHAVYSPEPTQPPRHRPADARAGNEIDLIDVHQQRTQARRLITVIAGRVEEKRLSSGSQAGAEGGADTAMLLVA